MREPVRHPRRPPTRSTAPRSAREKTEDGLSLVVLVTVALLFLALPGGVGVLFVVAGVRWLVGGASGGTIVVASFLIVLGLVVAVGVAAVALPAMLRGAAASTSLGDGIRRMSEVVDEKFEGNGGAE